MNSNLHFLIPAFQPSSALADLVAELVKLPDTVKVIIVDDGSGAEYHALFDTVGKLGAVELLRHEVNLGKGAALKTGINHVIATAGDEALIVTVDADGQHAVADALKVAARAKEMPDAIVLGVRQFGAEVPWKSRFGNKLTRVVLRLFTGLQLSDTQTGLRAFSGRLARRFLQIPAQRYEFEIDMLLLCRHFGLSFVEVPIATIYIDDNRGSHFNPLVDSMKIYFTLLRFTSVSVMTAVLDNIVFLAGITFGATVLQSQVFGRLLAMLFNYSANYHLVFYSNQRHTPTFGKYFLLVLALGVVSYSMILLFHERLGLSVIAAKLLAETIIFIANFLVQRDLIFSRRTLS